MIKCALQRYKKNIIKYMVIYNNNKRALKQIDTIYLNLYMIKEILIKNKSRNIKTI